jgi:hypothetical protein
MNHESIRCPECSRLREKYVEAIQAVIHRGATRGWEYQKLVRREANTRQAWRSHEAACKPRQ